MRYGKTRIDRYRPAIALRRRIPTRHRPERIASGIVRLLVARLQLCGCG